MKLFWLLLIISFVVYAESYGFWLYTEKNFSGWNWWKGTTCTFNGERGFRREDWMSLKADTGSVCFIYSSNDCSGGTCDLCVDDSGWRDISSIRNNINTNSIRCVEADGAKCSDASCKYK